MLKEKYKAVFVVLVYRNTSDLKDFFSNLNLPDSKVIVVNSYYDEISKNEFEQIARRYKADFINMPNKGYGAGNNRGIEFALQNYEFEFLIISNADVTIRQLNINNVSKDKVTAPMILTISGKNQNPSTPFSPTKLKDYLLYKTYKGNHNRLIWTFWAYSRLTKIVYYCIKGFRKTVFSPHGAFVIIPLHILKECVPLFNEKMFLFNEESHLGRKLKTKRFQVVYNPDIIILHKEDGSVSLLDKSLFNLQRDSFLELYRYWHK